MLQFGSSPSRKLKAAAVARFWIVLTGMFASWLLAAAAGVPASKPQIQGGNLRIEFDNRLRSRVVACFDKKETVMGPFTASETVTTADKALDRIPPDLAETRAHKRRFRRGRAAHRGRKSGNADKESLRHRI